MKLNELNLPGLIKAIFSLAAKLPQLVCYYRGNRYYHFKLNQIEYLFITLVYLPSPAFMLKTAMGVTQINFVNHLNSVVCAKFIQI